MRHHIVSIPFLPRVSRKSCPIGSGRSVESRRGTDVVAKEAEIKSASPSSSVAPTPTTIAIGAAHAALATSSDIWAAESSRWNDVSPKVLA